MATTAESEGQNKERMRKAPEQAGKSELGKKTKGDWRDMARDPLRKVSGLENRPGIKGRRRMD